MSMFGLPDLLHQVGVDVGDLEYIEGKVIAGDYFQVSGDINALNDTISFIPVTGKTAFLIEAKIVSTTHPDLAVFTGTQGNSIMDSRVQAQLQINSVVKDTANTGIGGTTSSATAGNGMGGFGDQKESKFNVLGLSLVGNAVKKIEIKNTLDNGSAFATMSGYLV